MTPDILSPVPLEAAQPNLMGESVPKPIMVEMRKPGFMSAMGVLGKQFTIAFSGLTAQAAEAMPSGMEEPDLAGTILKVAVAGGLGGYFAGEIGRTLYGISNRLDQGYLRHYPEGHRERALQRLLSSGVGLGIAVTLRFGPDIARFLLDHQ